VELDAITPRLSWLQQVVDLVTVDVYRQDGMLRLPHELLAQMGADEPAGSDHADLESGDGLAIQVQSRRHCVQMGVAMQVAPKREEIPQGWLCEVAGGTTTTTTTAARWSDCT
jgi:hypothetical protein